MQGNIWGQYGAGYCHQQHHSDDPVQHAKDRLKAIEAELAKGDALREEAARLKRMIAAAEVERGSDNGGDKQ